MTIDVKQLAEQVADPETESPVNNGLITLTEDEMVRFAQAIRNAALDEAAEVCLADIDTDNIRDDWDAGWAAGKGGCADAIRALKGETK